MTIRSLKFTALGLAAAVAGTGTAAAQTVVQQPYQAVETVRTTTVVPRAAARHVTRVRKSVARRETGRRDGFTPAQLATIARLIRRDHPIPARTQTVTERIVTAPAYAPPAVAPVYAAPPYAQPVYSEAAPPPAYDNWSDSDRYQTDRYPDEATLPPAPVTAPPPVVVERVAPPPAGIVIGAPLPATIPVYAMPPRAISQVPGVSGYRYAYVNGQMLLVDPNTNVVLATLQQ